MNKKLFIDLLQNAALVILSVTAVLLMLQFPMLDGAISGRMHALLSSPESAPEKNFDLATAVTAVHFVVTDDYEYGRCTRINASTSEAEFQKIAPLFREAIGSAAEQKNATETEFRAALKSSGIYIDLTTVLPVSMVAAWLGEELVSDSNIRALALTTAQETAMLYFLKEDGSVVRCVSALSSSGVREITVTFAPNGGRFAYETEYAALSPYTVMVQDVDAVAQIGAALPAGYSAYNLLTALEFNAHTNSRYTESGGAEVVIQSPQILKIGPDGTVRYSSDGEVTNELYRVVSMGSEPTSAEVLQAACLLANALSEGTNAAQLSFDGAEKTDDGWIILFCYRVGGIRVRLNEDRAALRVIITGDRIVEFEYYCRAYTTMQETDALLPPSIAVAIAAMYEDAELSIAYVDNGASMMTARWFAQ